MKERIKLDEKTKKETEAEAKLKKVVSFKEAQIHQFEANVLEKIEALTNKRFTKVDKIEWNTQTQMGFSASNNQIVGIEFYECGLYLILSSANNEIVKELVNL